MQDKQNVNSGIILLFSSILLTSIFFAISGVDFIDKHGGDIEQTKSGIELNSKIQNNWAFQRALEVGPGRYWRVVTQNYKLLAYSTFALFSASLLICLTSIIQELKKIKKFLTQ